MHLGIHLRDYAGFYPYGALIERCPLVDTTVLYAPEATKAEGRAQLSALGAEESLLLDESPESDFLEAARSLAASGNFELWGDEQELLARTVDDGLFQRDYVLLLMEEYMDRSSGDLLLALPAYSYRREDFQHMAEARGRKVLDPLDLLLPENQGEGKRNYRWRHRDFALERWAAELLGSRPLFQSFRYNPAWHESRAQFQRLGGIWRRIREGSGEAKK
ncbi:MAG: hypothetical protein Q4E76_04845 [Tissierellia bacterium]|nr:hypothetical protein [Tissierellia bacterium]